MAYSTDGTIGVDLDGVTTGTTTDGVNALFPLGLCVNATDGQVYQYVQAAEAITQYDWVGVDENHQMNQLSATEAGDGWTVGVAQVAFADNELGWVAIRGQNLQGRVLLSCNADAALRTSATAGALDDNTTGTEIRGAVCVAGNTLTTTTNVEVLLTWPRSATF